MKKQLDFARINYFTNIFIDIEDYKRNIKMLITI